MTFKKGSETKLNDLLYKVAALKKQQLEQQKEEIETKIKSASQLLQLYVEQANKSK